jgi:hypothetical protein
MEAFSKTVVGYPKSWQVFLFTIFFSSLVFAKVKEKENH